MQWLAAILILPYFYLLLRIYRSLLKLELFIVNSEPATFVSVVVACRNEQDNLPLLLSCIARQDYSGELLEVIIVDDNSTDRTYEIASDFKRTGNVVALSNNGKGKKQALRTGINASSGKLIITTDADCRMEKSWIRTIVAFYEYYTPDMIVCPVQTNAKSGFFGRFQELEFLSLQGITAGSALTGEGTMCNGANLSFTREAYLNHTENLHDEINSGDDIFLLHSLKRQTHSKILWLESHDAVVTAASSSTIMSFLKQRRRWLSKGKAYNDRFTVILGIVTFVTILLQVSTLFAAFFNAAFIPVFVTILILKLIPDFMILQNTCRRYRKKNLLNWFLPAQFIYPFYVLGVVFYALISPKNYEY